jgi:hypothetical protein
VLLPYVLIIASVLIIAVALRFCAEPDDPGNTTVHQQEDEPPDTGDAAGPDDVLAAA